MPSLMKARSGVLNSNIGGNALAPLFSTGALTIANAITDVTRLAGVEGDGATYPASRAGVWPAATNLVTNGGFETGTTGWTAWASGASMARVTTEAKFGSASLQLTVTGGVSRGARATVDSLSASAAYTASAWVKAPSGADLKFVVYDTPITTVLASTVFAGTGDWQRVTATFTSDADGGTHYLFITTNSDIGAVVFYIDGVQLEPGSIATPYIETDGGTASRSAGSIAGIPASVLDETQMWVMARVSVDSTQTGSGRVFSFADSANDRLEMLIALTNNRTFVQRHAGGVGTTLTAGSGTIAVGDTAFYFAGFTSGNIYATNNGAALSSAANTSIPVLAATDAALGKQAWASFGYPGASILWVAIGKGVPTDELSALGNSWGNNDPLPHMFPRSAQLTFLAHFNGDGAAYRYKA